MRILRVGIIGQGRSGYGIHAHYLQTAPGREKFKIVMVADLLKDRREQAQKEFGCDASEDFHDLFGRDDIDFIVNATPSHLHPPVTRACLKAGFNVLCEKPLARRAKDADSLIELSKKMGKVLAVYQQSRFSPQFVKILEVIDSGVLGRIVMAKVAVNGFGRRWDWQTLQCMNGGSLLNTGPHPLGHSLLLFDRGLTMPNVWCRMDRANSFGDAEDHVKLMLWAKGKPHVDMEISSCCAYPTYTFQVYGTCGGLTCSGTKVQWKYFDPTKAPKQKLIRTPMTGRVYCGEQLPWQEEEWDKPMSFGEQFDYMAEKFYNNLYEVLTEGKPLAVPLAHVRRSVAVMEEAHRQNPLSKLKQ